MYYTTHIIYQTYTRDYCGVCRPAALCGPRTVRNIKRCATRYVLSDRNRHSVVLVKFFNDIYTEVEGPRAV